MFDIRQQSTDRDYKTLKAGQKCEIIVIIEKNNEYNRFRSPAVVDLYRCRKVFC